MKGYISVVLFSFICLSSTQRPSRPINFGQPPRPGGGPPGGRPGGGPGGPCPDRSRPTCTCSNGIEVPRSSKEYARELNLQFYFEDRKIIDHNTDGVDRFLLTIYQVFSIKSE